MDWLADNWIGILVVAAFAGMHLFGHRGHGRHSSGHGHRRPRDGEPDDPAQSSDAQAPEDGQRPDRAGPGFRADAHKH